MVPKCSKNGKKFNKEWLKSTFFSNIFDEKIIFNYFLILHFFQVLEHYDAAIYRDSGNCTLYFVLMPLLIIFRFDVSFFWSSIYYFVLVQMCKLQRVLFLQKVISSLLYKFDFFFVVFFKDLGGPDSKDQTRHIQCSPASLASSHLKN